MWAQHTAFILSCYLFTLPVKAEAPLPPGNIHIRTLAASCAACHGTTGNSVGVSPVLAGLDPAYFTTQMLAFKNGARSSTVMHHHAKALNTGEIYDLAVYFSMQNREANSTLKSQALKVNHE